MSVNEPGDARPRTVVPRADAIRVGLRAACGIDAAITTTPNGYGAVPESGARADAYTLARVILESFVADPESGAVTIAVTKVLPEPHATPAWRVEVEVVR